MAAVDEVLALLRDRMTVCTDALLTEAEGFTCTEADAMADVLKLLAMADTADAFLRAHAEGDNDTEDAHERTDAAPGWRHR